MRGGAARAVFPSAIYPLVVALMPVVASAAYSGAEFTAPTVMSQSVQPSVALNSVRPDHARVVAAATTIPVPPITTVLSPSASDQLQADLAAMAAGSGGQVAVDLEELSGPRRISLSINGNQSFYAASTYKLPLLMDEAEQIAAGQVSPADSLCYDPSDQEDGWFTDYDVGSCFTRQDLATRAGRYSDNTAAHILVRYLGGPDALNQYAQSVGMTNSALWDPNLTTATDLSAAWVNETLGRLGGPVAQQWLYPILTHTAFEDGIPAGLPASASVVHKIGSMYDVETDAALVTNGGVSYVLAVSVGGPDEATGWSLIAQISQRIWQYEAGRPDYVAPVSVSPTLPLWPDRRH